MRSAAAVVSIGLSGLTLAADGSEAQRRGQAPPPSPVYTISLGGRDACVSPCTTNRARADGGFIDVQTPSPDAINVVMSGIAAADSYLGCTSKATQTFRLVQQFEVSCSDPSVREVSLTLDSTLVGYVRSMWKAGACVRLAGASVTPASWDATPLSLAHPPLCVSETQGRLCNQHLPPVQGPPMPLGRFTLVADLVLESTAGGVRNAHAVADFSPDAGLPPDWVRMRDPFQGVAKKSFGFTLTVSAAQPSATAAPRLSSAPPSSPAEPLRRAAFVPGAATPARRDPSLLLRP
jgi:hypothetical protein